MFGRVKARPARFPGRVCRTRARPEGFGGDGGGGAADDGRMQMCAHAHAVGRMIIIA